MLRSRTTTRVTSSWRSRMLQGISTRFCGRTESCTIWAGWGGPDAGLVGSFKGNVEMNERGQVVACSDTNSTINPVTGTPTIDPFLWDKEEGMIDLGTLGGTSGCAIYLNNRGQVVGYSNVAGDLTLHPFLWDRGVIKDLG